MPRATPGLSTSEYHRQLKVWGCKMLRSARGGGHTLWEAPNGQTFSSLNESNSSQRKPTFVVVDQGAAAIGITRDQLLHGQPLKIKGLKVEAKATESCTENCNAPHYPCLCRKGRTHDGDHLCFCGRSWK